ncbi:hypothetical protein [Sphingomonas jaspsi]|uniref:hypothetical protein n=1 Tax=Sphingomonas jaspsi TaxID=392409 RepID=UPI0004AF74DF|nr:hypothetical protein [Sphingomonas jaspsi]
MSRVLELLETLPSAAEVRAERERTGEGMMTIVDRHKKDALMRAIGAVKNIDDVTIILARIVERMR